jgi:hypothetical protein
MEDHDGGFDCDSSSSNGLQLSLCGGDILETLAGTSK